MRPIDDAVRRIGIVVRRSDVADDDRPRLRLVRTLPRTGRKPLRRGANTSGMPPLNLGGMQIQTGYWFGSLAGLVMTRDLPNGLSTTYNATNVNTNLMDTSQVHANWAGGGQVMFGRWFGPQTWGTQFVYWGTGPMTGTASVVDPNYNLSTTFNEGGVNIGPQQLDKLFRQRVQAGPVAKGRLQQLRVERHAARHVRLLPPRLMFTGFAGVRYFRFQDSLLYGSVNSLNFSDAEGPSRATSIRASPTAWSASNWARGSTTSCCHACGSTLSR